MLYFLIAALIVLLDQAAKYIVTLELTPGIPVELIPGVIRLDYAENTGAAFSFLSDMRWILVGVSVVVIALIIVLIVSDRWKITHIGKLGLAAILGGAFANLIDRALFGYVVDFFEFEFIRFAIFNVADIFITVGGAVFCIYYLFHKGGDDSSTPKKQRRAKSGDSVPAAEDVGDQDSSPEEDHDTDPS